MLSSIAVTSSSSSTSGYSAFWVGLGGSSGESGSLEQAGTAGEWVNGQAVYYAWYELLPAAQVKLDLPIDAGDHMSASVTAQGSTVTLHIVDETSGGSVTKTLSMSNPDTSSAEWIAEAPAAQSASGDYETLPLANFGTVTYTAASATAGGHTGSISDSNWTAEQVSLVSGGDAAAHIPGRRVSIRRPGCPRRAPRRQRVRRRCRAMAPRSRSPTKHRQPAVPPRVTRSREVAPTLVDTATAVGTDTATAGPDTATARRDPAGTGTAMATVRAATAHQASCSKPSTFQPCHPELATSCGCCSGRDRSGAWHRRLGLRILYRGHLRSR